MELTQCLQETNTSDDGFINTEYNQMYYCNYAADMILIMIIKTQET